MSRKPGIPSYRRHSGGLARVTIRGKDYLLGTWQSQESREKYRRIIRRYLDWLAKRPDKKRGRKARQRRLTVDDLCLRWWEHARVYYRWDTEDRGDEDAYRAAIKILRGLYGTSRAIRFGPRRLKAVRGDMIAAGWSRRVVNDRVKRLVAIWTWAVGEELLPASTAQALRAVKGLRKGRSKAREKAKVKPVDLLTVAVTVARMTPLGKAMVEWQYWTGCRPAEVCRLRPRDLDKTNPACWVYRPGSDQGEEGDHKTSHLGKCRLILIGPQAQGILAPWLEECGPDAYVFSPVRLRRRPSRLLADKYTTRTYRQLVTRARKEANADAIESARKKGQQIEDKADLVQRWGPNQLRHTRATELRKHGIDNVKTILGHSRVETTEIYAEKDLAAAMEVVGRVG